MGKYVKKPVIVEAVQWKGDNLDELCRLGDFKLHYTLSDGLLGIYTLEGIMWASVGDFIIMGVRGEFYPCKPGIFYDTYDRVD